MVNINHKKTYAKDPIDFIRNFKFAVFQTNPGSTTGPSRIEHSLYIRLIDAMGRGATEVFITPEQFHAAPYVADWLDKQVGMTVLPLAPVESQNTNATLITVPVTAPDLRFSVVKEELDIIIKHVSTVMASVKAGDVSVIRPSYEPRPEHQGGGQFRAQKPGQVIGHIVLDDPRTPSGYPSRAPQGATGGTDNW